MERFISLFGLIFLIFICYLISEDRKHINWKLVITGVLMQFALGILILKWSYGRFLFNQFSDLITTALSYTLDGTKFLFGNLLDTNSIGFIFALQVLPTIIFVSALMAILYHIGIMEVVVSFIAKIMLKLLGTSGAESLAAAANIFVGQTEAPLIIKPYLKEMTRSELLTVMVGGMASVSGGVLAGYIALGLDAGHLISASLMSAPASLVIAKIIVPETDHPKTMGTVQTKLDAIDSNLIDAASRGTSEGLGLAMNVGAMLLSFTAIVALLNGGLGGLGHLINSGITGISHFFGTSSSGFAFLNHLSLETILGTIFSPIAWIMGVPAQDMFIAGNLLGQKTILNEFYAYSHLGEILKAGQISERTTIILTYALCGFANLASIGIQVGGIGNLVPEKRPVIAELGIKALIGGTVAAFMTATVAGILI